jgi:hypothetical protein
VAKISRRKHDGLLVENLGRRNGRALRGKKYTDSDFLLIFLNDRVQEVKSPFMSGNNLGMVAASHSSSNRVVGVEVVSTTFSSMFLTEILMSVLTPIPPKSTCSSAAIDCARDAAAFVAD